MLVVVTSVNNYVGEFYISYTSTVISLVQWDLSNPVNFWAKITWPKITWP